MMPLDRLQQVTDRKQENKDPFWGWSYVSLWVKHADPLAIILKNSSHISPTLTKTM